MNPTDTPLQRRIEEIGREIYDQMSDTSPSAFDPQWWSGHLLEWAMRDESFKVQLFRFIDVLPVLPYNRQVGKLLREYFEDTGEALPEIFRRGVRAASGPLTSLLAAPAVRKNMEFMAHRFIIGTDPTGSLEVLEKLRSDGLTFTVDLLGEATLSNQEADVYRDRCLDAISTLSEPLAAWEENPLLDRDGFGEIPRLNLSVKLSALSPAFDPVRWDASLSEMKPRLYPILRKAAGVSALVNFDLEHYDQKALTYAVFHEILAHEEFCQGPPLGVVVQSYLQDAASDLESMVRWAETFQRRITIRLVKGAYWDYETVVRSQRGWKVPVFLNKEATDLNYERLSRELLAHADKLAPAFASHNVRSLAHAAAVAEEMGLDKGDFEFQMLNGMAEPIRKALVALGFRVRVYAPIGEMLPGMAYLVRRLLENTSNESFLRKNFVEATSFEELMCPPVPPEAPSPAAAAVFLNEPHTDFSDGSLREQFAGALNNVEGSLGETHSLLIDGREVTTAEQILSVNPAAPDNVVGKVCAAERKHADQAVAAARAAWETWQRVPAEERAGHLFRAAEAIGKRRFDFAALQVFEVGKNWLEADADVCEAIDFLNYYGREMIRLGERRRLSDYPGELNLYHYVPRGVGVVISPWNFPLAIAAGMTAAGLAAGNCMILKPSSNSPVTAAWLVEVLRHTGIPDGVIQFLPGSGAAVGNHLVSHPGVDLIAFTGSREVGLGILKRAAETQAGQRHVKQVIAEMGGKNAVIIDESADLDEAVQGVVASAFGFQGQKCSACSRAIVLRSVVDTFVRRLVEATRSLRMGPPADSANQLGPVIDAGAKEKIEAYIRVGTEEGTPVFIGEAPTSGYYVPCAIFSDIHPSHRLFREEIFGPVLAITEARDLSEALTLANDSEYGLTGGLFSRSPEAIGQVQSAFDVGNLYINRGITGALVGRQPFGGARMSGIGSKAGGPDYLQQFMIPRSICENTLRRGFAPPD
jgi:RHH-type proline utilization regulon transcriptional repressor/proline dehydrogenase/delta 1-pyrroline-5-carboxylate dehydrogenase